MATLLPAAVAANNRQLDHRRPLARRFAELPIVVQQQAVLADLGSKWQVLQSQVKAPVHVEPAAAQKVGPEFQRNVAGKSRGEYAKGEMELLEKTIQALRQEDPKTLQKMREYIESSTQG